MALPPQGTSTAIDPEVIDFDTAIGQPMSLETKRRVEGHERLIHTICALARHEAEARGLVLRTIEVRPAWFREPDEQTEVVIDVEVKTTADERFAYWDAVCERLYDLETMLSPEQQRFLRDDIAFFVNRS